jgi:hypothetical protein
MKIVMKPQGQDEFFFDQLSNLSFSPETDLSGNKLPSNTFECDVHTNYQFEQGMWVELQDDMDNLFARYWLVDSVYKGRGKNGYISVYHIKCESPLGVFDKVKMPAKMYNTTAQGVLTEILERPANNVYVVTNPEGKEILIPVVPAFILRADAENGVVTVRLLEGM